jgi:hypothetical protein
MRDMNSVDLMVVAGMFALCGLLLYLGFNAARNAQQTSVRKALLEKFASAQDLAAFLQTGGGQKFMAELSSGAGSPLQSVLGSIHKGIIAIFLGMGFFPLSGGFKDPWAITGIGIVLILVGSGFLVSAIITYLLSRRWGLLSSHSKVAEK